VSRVDLWNAERKRVDGLQLPGVIIAGDVFNWSKASQTVLKRKRIADRHKPVTDRITDRLLHGEMPVSVEEVAREIKTNCKEVRSVVLTLKRQGLLIESSFPKHILLRLKEGTL